MKRSFFLIFAVAALLLAACESPGVEEQTNVGDQPDSNAYSISSPMHPACWINEHTLQKEMFHSSPWASKIDSSWQDSYGFRDYFRNIGTTIPKTIDIRFWAYFPKTEIDAKVVIGIDSVDQQTFWAGINLIDSIKTANEWQPLHITLNTPAKVSPDHKLTIYVWGYDKQLMYVDDLAVSFTY